jgi:predicted Zn-dependent peptidase
MSYNSKEVFVSTLKNYKQVILFLLLFFLPLPCFALPGSPVKVHSLDNGMQVITKEEHSKNLVAINIYVKVGSRTEYPEISGLSHYYEHLIFRGGTDKQKELETRKAFQSLGQFFGFTSEDVTCYYMVAPKENLDEALWRYADAVMNLKVTQEKIESERQVVLEEFNMDEDQPDYYSWLLLEKSAYRRWTYMQSRLGSAPFTFEMGVSPENFTKAQSGILNEVKNLLKSPLPEKDVETAKANLISGFYLSQQTNTDQARTMAFYEMAGLGYLYGDTYPDMVKKVKTSEIAKAAKKYLDPERFTLVAVGKVEDKK